MKGQVLILIIVNIVLNVDAEIQSVEVKDGDEAMLLFKSGKLSTHGCLWTPLAYSNEMLRKQ